ncbi:MAG: MBL fold metallo-hydrolase [Actinomycetota bacterium]
MQDLPSASPWYVRDRIDESISLITEPHVHPFLRCNVWHVRGRDRDLVVDTALGLAPLRTVVEDLTDNDLVAVATHTHADHVGALWEFDDRVLHGAEADTVAADSIASVETGHYPDSCLGPYRAAGYDFDAYLVDAVPKGAPAASVFEIKAAPATRLVDEGDVVDLGDRAFEVLHLPGHSPGSIGLWEASTGVLFSGDALYDGPLLDELAGADLDDYEATIRRLRRLPVTVVHAGHEGSFGRRRLVELCDAYLAGRATTSQPSPGR